MLAFGKSLRLIGQTACRLGRPRSLHLSAYNAVVMHARNENGYFKEIYSDDLRFPELEPLFKSERIVQDQSIASFDNVVRTAEITSSDLVPYFRSFTEKLKQKDVDSLIYVLNRLRESKCRAIGGSIYEMISFIDQALSEHLKGQESINEEQFKTYFQTALLFDEIGLQSWSQFICRLASKSLQNFNLFESKENLLRALYVLNLSRKQISSEKAMLIELQVMRYFYHNELDLKELGLICLSFHKTQTKFQTPLMERVAEKLIDELDSTKDTVCVASILKGIFSSDHRLDAAMIGRLGDKLQTMQVADLHGHFLVLTKFLSILKKYRIYDERLINSVLDSFAQQDSVRIKELSRLLLNLLFFDVQLNSKQIGKFNEKFEQNMLNYAPYRAEYLLSVYSLACHGLIRREEVANIYEPDFIRALRSNHAQCNYFLMNLNNILKLFGDANYGRIAYKDRDLLRTFRDFESLSKGEVYARFKKFERYPSKLYLCYQTLKDTLGARVHLVHLLPGCKYPHIVISPQATQLKDYPFEVAPGAAVGLSVVRIPSPEMYCDQRTQKLTGFYQMENDFLRKMGFRLFELENALVSHTASELRLYLSEQVLEHLEDQPLSAGEETEPREAL